MMNKCLYCYQPLLEGEIDFHTKCSKKFFELNNPPMLPFGKNDLKLMAKEVIAKSITVTGVQAKLSLDIEQIDGKQSRLTVVGLWGNYILKPPTEIYEQLPENEDLSMKLATLCGIKTAEHSLIRLESGELAYLTKRFDRTKSGKIHVEDFCQLTETLTEHKYRSSMEKIGKTIRKFSSNAGFDLISFFELSIFCFLTGNADMHLKNFSLLYAQSGEIQFAPAYDLVSTKLVIPDDEEMALTINGRKNRLKREDFDVFAKNLGINEKVKDNIYKKFSNKIPAMKVLVDESFLSEEMKEIYKTLIQTRGERLDFLTKE
ncbi:type II toxin-antitoxin system HipA family toxin [Arcicella rigui]|uniref:HipA domain-containing protein n=1 Tax=Arcicella rigui TaxID=797020 RepID=A0ABU5QDX6_9BACT|nr:HipA domain-containing protein [Arcicella rigui]MEA5141046.1 HipA domain-containing protein [Arcicella rigui]